MPSGVIALSSWPVVLFLHRPEQRTVFIGAVPGGIEVIVDQRVRAGMQRQIPRLAAFAGNSEMRHAFARVLNILHLQLAQFLAPQRVEQQRRQDGAVALALDGVGLRRIQQFARLMIADRWRLAFAAFRLRPLDAFDRIVGDGVFLAEIFEQRGERREPMPDRAAAKPAPHEIVAPGDDVRARHGAKFLRPLDAGEAHEVLHRVLVSAAGVAVRDVGEPFDLGRHVGELVELGGGQQPGGSQLLWSGVLADFIRGYYFDKICYQEKLAEILTGLLAKENALFRAELRNQWSKQLSGLGFTFRRRSGRCAFNYVGEHRDHSYCNENFCGAADGGE